jgi:hypothetical protein
MAEFLKWPSRKVFRKAITYDIISIRWRRWKHDTELHGSDGSITLQLQQAIISGIEEG